MKNMFELRYQDYLVQIESALEAALPSFPMESGGLVVEAARYSLLAGGKRIRPVLLLATMDCLDADRDLGLPFAVAIEMIHTYSLIHDDLPCMDDDDFRRGRPTCHKVYGEAVAVLAGDALLNRAYEIILDNPMSGRHEGSRAGFAIAKAAGASGMIAGQTLDLAAEGKIIDAQALQLLHRQKTGQLIAAPVRAACLLANAPDPVQALLEQFAEKLGLAFQIMDDILDVTASAEKLGKSIGKDSRDQKSTYVTLFGLEQANALLQLTTHEAISALEQASQSGRDTTFLISLADFLLNRDH